MKKLSLLLFSAGLFLQTNALDLPPGVSAAPSGELKLANSGLKVSIAGSTWNSRPKWNGIRQTETADRLSVTGKLNLDGTLGTYSQTLKQNGKNRWQFESRLEFPETVFTKMVCTSWDIPLPAGTISVDGKPIRIPPEFRGQVLFPKSPAKSVTVELAGGIRATASGTFSVYVQDNRQWNQTVSIRIYAAEAEGTIRKTGCRFNLELIPPKTSTAGIDSAAVSGSDGSILNALQGLRSGIQTVSGIPFRIGSHTAVADRTTSPTIRLDRTDFPAGAVNLLHASAWNPAKGKTTAFLDIRYRDGKMQSIPVRAGIDCADWQTPLSAANAAIALRRNALSGPAVLYASSFPLSGKEPQSITFRVTDPSVRWLIAAATLSNHRIFFPPAANRPVVIRQDRNWKPFRFSKTIVKGSPLDFSTSLDAPAGKYGFVRSSANGEFVFENAPEKKIRFFGTNVCMGANFPDKKTADELVDRLAVQGYNSLRFHHHDNGMIDRDAADSVTLDPEKMDRMDYLFAKCKERGIYLTTDFYTSRSLRKGDQLSGTGTTMKALLPVDRKAMENWKTFVRRWMEHRNPYTGLKWGEDPALLCVNLVNEDTLFSHWSRTPETESAYRTQFEKWRKTNGAGRESFPRFLHEMQSAELDELLDFVKNELKLKTMVTSLNWMTDLPLTVLRDKFDLVDNHQYFSHPEFPEKKWSLPQLHDQGSSIRRSALVPRLVMPTRIFGKPFIMTEFNFCNPNRFRAENGPLMGSLAALQNWAGLWRFGWSHGERGIREFRPGGCFDGVNDPMQQLSDPIIHALFIRGDLAPAEEKISFAVPRMPFSNGVPERFPDEFSMLGLNAQIGSHVQDKQPDGKIRIWQPGTNVAKDRRIRLNRDAGTFSVATPFSEALVLPEGSLKAETLQLRNVNTFTTFAAIALDRRPLPRSHKILIIHLTDFTTEGIRFRDETRTLLQSWGGNALLIRHGTAVAELKTESPLKITALAQDGSAAGTVKGSFANGILRFSVDNCAFPGGTVAYLLEKSP